MTSVKFAPASSSSNYDGPPSQSSAVRPLPNRVVNDDVLIPPAAQRREKLNFDPQTFWTTHVATHHILHDAAVDQMHIFGAWRTVAEEHFPELAIPAGLKAQDDALKGLEQFAGERWNRLHLLVCSELQERIEALGPRAGISVAQRLDDLRGHVTRQRLIELERIWTNGASAKSKFPTAPRSLHSPKEDAYRTIVDDLLAQAKVQFLKLHGNYSPRAIGIAESVFAVAFRWLAQRGVSIDKQIAIDVEKAMDEGKRALVVSTHKHWYDIVTTALAVRNSIIFAGDNLGALRSLLGRLGGDMGRREGSKSLEYEMYKAVLKAKIEIVTRHGFAFDWFAEGTRQRRHILEELKVGLFAYSRQAMVGSLPHQQALIFPINTSSSVIPFLADLLRVARKATPNFFTFLYGVYWTFFKNPINAVLWLRVRGAAAVRLPHPSEKLALSPNPPIIPSNAPAIPKVSSTASMGSLVQSPPPTPPLKHERYRGDLGPTMREVDDALYALNDVVPVDTIAYVLASQVWSETVEEPQQPLKASLQIGDAPAAQLQFDQLDPDVRKELADFSAMLLDWGTREEKALLVKSAHQVALRILEERSRKGEKNNSKLQTFANTLGVVVSNNSSWINSKEQQAAVLHYAIDMRRYTLSRQALGVRKSWDSLVHLRNLAERLGLGTDAFDRHFLAGVSLSVLEEQYTQMRSKLERDEHGLSIGTFEQGLKTLKADGTITVSGGMVTIGKPLHLLGFYCNHVEQKLERGS